MFSSALFLAFIALHIQLPYFCFFFLCFYYFYYFHYYCYSLFWNKFGQFKISNSKGIKLIYNLDLIKGNNS